MTLDPQQLRSRLLDHRGLDLDAARRVTYVIEQSFRYDYDAPVQSLRQRLVIVPPARHGGQHRRAHQLEVTGAQARRRVRAGPPRQRGHLAAGRARGAGRGVPADRHRRADPPRRARRAAARGARSPALLSPTRLTAADDRLRELAARLPASAVAPLDRAEWICDLVHASLDYADGVTSVRTTAAEALAGGRGVCQDMAHVMLALCHLVGLPARYVSGHLIGQGGTHAWVEVVVPRARDAIAVPFDPCHGRRAGSAYVTVATGRDYSDVAPASGSYVGTSGSRLTAQRRVGVLAAA